MIKLFFIEILNVLSKKMERTLSILKNVEKLCLCQNLLPICNFITSINSII